MSESNLYIQNICSECLQKLVNDEGDHMPEELERFEKTLKKWAKELYYPAGLTDNTEPSFSWSKCDLCNTLAGDRYEYYFIGKSLKK
jgi:hypothetical protein